MPLPGIEIAFGENDALLVKGPNVMLGYLGAQLKGFPGYAQVRRVAVAAEPWTVDNGMLTPTLKLRRAQILERHKDLMAELYKGHS